MLGGMAGPGWCFSINQLSIEHIFLTNSFPLNIFFQLLGFHMMLPFLTTVRNIQTTLQVLDLSSFLKEVSFFSTAGALVVITV